MAGIYIHIPFCRRACHYCDFHFTTNLKNTKALVDAIVKEIGIRKSYLKNENISTIYFGGGTPSLLDPADIALIIDEIRSHNQVDVHAEITLEANPEDLKAEKLSGLRKIGINRLSLGTQSFIDSELTWMNRMHTSEQAKSVISQAQKEGFDNISIDLIFGLPDQTAEDWQFNLDTAIGLNVQHISSYSLTVEPKTVLHNNISKGLQSSPNEDAAANYLQMNMNQLPKAGFEHYEISNYAQEGFISQHNSSYWKGVPYLGLGPSAHSFNGESRQWNVRSNAAYMSKLNSNGSFFEVETLTEKDRLNELILTGLRTKWGIQKSDIEKVAPSSWSVIEKAAITQTAGLLNINAQSIRLTPQGVLVADNLTSELFF